MCDSHHCGSENQLSCTEALFLGKRQKPWAWFLQSAIEPGEPGHRRRYQRARAVVPPRTTLAAWDLINGLLVRPFPESLRISKTYWIICPKATASLPKIVTFRDWLLAEAFQDLRQLKKLSWSLKIVEADR
jgi:hypothetical protein